MSSGEKRVMYIFILAVIGWVFREGFTFDRLSIPGWSKLAGMEDFVTDSTVGMIAAMLLFMVPDGKGKRLLDWKSAGSIPWGVGVIVGGGYALAASFKSTGLANWLGSELAFVSTYPTLVVLFIVVGAVLIFTELNSNTATANIFLPVLASMAVAGNINPLVLMIPATFASSMVFIMPAGTGPNTVIFGSNKVTVQEMAHAGIWLKLISMIILPLLLYFLTIYVLGMDLALPEWAK
jgi:sodium-dependent dicarboxylate transporter 2/3/5